MYRSTLFASVALLALVAGCNRSETPEPASPGTEATIETASISGNPLLGDWDTPYGVPPFSTITEADYMPAIEKGIDDLRSDIKAILDNPEDPTFLNTIVALDEAGSTLSQVANVFGNITSTDTNDTLRELETQIYPMLTRETDAIFLNDDLFARVDAVYQQRESLDLPQQRLRLVELTHRDFVRRGAALEPAAKDRVKEINSRLSELTTKFSQNLVTETNSFVMSLTTDEDVAGLSDSLKASLEAEDGVYEVGLSRSEFESFMTQSENRDRRKQLKDAYNLRAAAGENDNGPLLIEIAQLRAERAELMGYDSHAHFTLETRMAKTPEQAIDFLLQVWEPGLARAKEELAEMQALVDAQGGGYTVEGHDWWHLSEKVRQDRYAFDDNELKPYFELASVRQGAFEVANKLFGLTFEEVDIPEWNPDVVSFDVKNADGEHLGVFMTDWYARDSKRGGAWMSTYRDASDVRETVRPIVTNNMNLIKPPVEAPTLMRYDEVETLFHEFGHGLHGLMTTIKYERMSGVGGPRDYTEFPAQIMEHWAGEPDVLLDYATHYETDEPIPMELIEKMRRASTFNQGFKTTEFIAASLLDMHWHMLSAEEAAQITDARAFEKEVLDRYGLIPEIEPRYRSQYFAHIFAGGYSAGYYSYLWSEILDADGFTAFKESGDIFNPELANRLAKWVFEAGDLYDADILYRRFRGQDPSIEPLLRIRGFDASGES